MPCQQQQRLLHSLYNIPYNDTPIVLRVTRQTFALLCSHASIIVNQYNNYNNCCCFCGCLAEFDNIQFNRRDPKYEL